MNSYVKIKVEGKNVNNYIKWLIKNKVNVIHLDIVKHNELDLIIDYKDYDLLSKYSKTYKVTTIRRYGKLKLFDVLKKNMIMSLCLLLSVIFLYMLSDVIFDIDIMYNDKNIVELVINELDKYDIKKFRKKKSYDYLVKVKESILNDNKDTLEWLEIEESGTKYIIRLVERKKENNDKSYLYQSVVAKKDATIVSIKANAGEKAKTVNEYVRKGDTIISGMLTKSDGTNIYMSATGIVLGEVWYKASIEYPLYYQEEKVTGKSKNVLSFYFLDNELPIFPYKKYKQFRKLGNVLVENNIVPVKIVKEKMYEVDIKEDIYTPEEAIMKATEEVKKKLIEKNHNIVSINNVMVLDKQNLNSKIRLNLFISTVEDISEITELIPDDEEKIEN